MRTQAALAAAIGADKTRIIRTLDDLQDDGYIEREPDPDDRRVRLLAITDAGRRVKDAVQDEIQRGEERWLGELERRRAADVPAGPRAADPDANGDDAGGKIDAIMSKPAERVVFSGVQPTSDSLHLGNALGAVSAVGRACRTSSTPTSASSTCTRSRSRRIRRRCAGARSPRPRSTWRWASTRSGRPSSCRATCPPTPNWPGCWDVSPVSGRRRG